MSRLPPFRAAQRSLSPSATRTRISSYVLMRECMGRYISPILVDAVLARAAAVRGVGEGPVHGEALSGLVEESMIGLRLFVDGSRLPDLMLELAEILQREDP